MVKRLIKMVIAGEGGQGVQSMADILAEAGHEEGMEAIYIPNFGIEQRGGVSVAFIQVGDQQIGSPKFEKGEIVVALSKRAVGRTLRYVGEKTVYVFDSSLMQVPRGSIPVESAEVIGIPATEIAKKDLNPRVFNMIVMGAVVEASGIITEEKVKKAIENKLGAKFAKDPRLRDLNFKALQIGMELVKEALVRS